MAKKLSDNNLGVVLVQIDEAHSTAWPIAIDSVLGVDEPQPQKSFSDRYERARFFCETYSPPYPVYIDNWDNSFAETFRVWPDKFYCVDKNLMVVSKSEYHSDEDKEAIIIEDYTMVLEKLCVQ